MVPSCYDGSYDTDGNHFVSKEELDELRSTPFPVLQHRYAF